jgi:hypothetical protein
MAPRDLGGWAMLGFYATGAAAGFVATVVLDKLLGRPQPLGYDPRLTDPGPRP